MEKKNFGSRLRAKDNQIRVLESRLRFWKEKSHSKKVRLIKTETNLKLSRKQKCSKCKTAREVLTKFFTQRQIKIFINGNKKTHWTEEDISKALCLRAKSISAYEFVRTSWKIPLPSISTLKRWITQIHLAPGLLQCVLSMLKYEFYESTDFNK